MLRWRKTANWRKCKGKSSRKQRCKSMVTVPSSWEHCLFLSFLNHTSRDSGKHLTREWVDILLIKKPILCGLNEKLTTGYIEIATSREANYEESLGRCRNHHNILLPLLRMLWLRSIWRCHTGQSLDRFRFLWAILARRFR